MGTQVSETDGLAGVRVHLIQNIRATALVVPLVVDNTLRFYEAVLDNSGAVGAWYLVDVVDVWIEGSGLVRYPWCESDHVI